MVLLLQSQTPVVSPVRGKSNYDRITAPYRKFVMKEWFYRNWSLKDDLENSLTLISKIQFYNSGSRSIKSVLNDKTTQSKNCVTESKICIVPVSRYKVFKFWLDDLFFMALLSLFWSSCNNKRFSFLFLKENIIFWSTVKMNSFYCHCMSIYKKQSIFFYQLVKQKLFDTYSIFQRKFHQ